MDDAGLLEAAGVNGADFRGGLPALLQLGTVAGAVVDGQNREHCANCRDHRTLRRHRSRHRCPLARPRVRHGCCFVHRQDVIQETGRTPVWSCGEDNIASLKVAQKLGFEEVSRLTYVFRQV